MRAEKYLIMSTIFLFQWASALHAGELRFSDYSVTMTSGPFANQILLTKKQKTYSEKWQKIMSKELGEPVNFAGHYRLYLSWGGEFPDECGSERWVCGWIVDKITGEIISTLPEFNGNTAYFTYSDNGTPSPDKFQPIFHPNSSMLWMEGTNLPAKKGGSEKCGIAIYNFRNNQFTPLFKGECN